MKSLRFFDSAATTPCAIAAVSRWVRCQEDAYGNPSSAHRLGREAAKEVTEARSFFAKTFGVPNDQVIFTASGSESDNLAVVGGALGFALPSFTSKQEAKPLPRVVVSSVEHPAVRQAALSLSDFGFEVRLLPVDEHAGISIESIERAITPETAVLSIMRVNNIVGATYDVETLARRAKELAPGILVHCDAVQAFGKVDVPVAGSSVDCVSISAHKLHGPKGIGALILLNRSLLTEKRIRPLIWGGGQEQGLRAGTTNAGLITAFAEAAQAALLDRDAFMQHCEQLSMRLLQGLQDRQVIFELNSPSQAVPYIRNLSFDGLPSRLVAKLLEDQGCMVSTGSACSAQKPERDSTLLAMGLPDSRVDAAVRISFSKENTLEDVDSLIDALVHATKTLRAMFKKDAPLIPEASVI